MDATPRLLIEPLAPSHAAGLYAALNHPDVSRYLTRPDVTTPEALHARLERLAAGPIRPYERWWNFAVRIRADDTIIGRLEATTYGDRGEIAYVFGPPWWGRGLATEATRWLVQQLAANGIVEQWATLHPDNTASRRLVTRLGFEPAPPHSQLRSYDPGDDVFRWLPERPKQQTAR